MKTITTIFLASTCLFSMEQGVYAMLGEEEQDIIFTRSKPQVLTQQEKSVQSLGRSSQEIGSEEEGESVLLPLENLMKNEQIDAEYPGRNLISLGLNSPPLAATALVKQADPKEKFP